MFKGFYGLTSGMLTQQRKLNTISNNMANASTPGYKKDVLTTTTFGEVLAHRTGSVDKNNPVQLGNVTMIRTVDELVTNYEQGILETTGRPLDAALIGEGFFEVETPTQGLVYTRNGSFTLDDEGYLYLQHIGRVMGQNGLPIRLMTDKVRIEPDGLITSEQNGNYLARLQVADFNDYSQLVKVGEGMFQNADAANMFEVETPQMMGKALERSNISMMDEMVSMISSQRALQSASQILKMYDQLMNKAANDIGRI